MTINQSYSFLSGMKPVQKKLKPKAIPHIFEWTKPKSASATDREARHAAKEKNVATEIPCDVMNIAQEIDVTTSEVTSSTELDNALHMFDRALTNKNVSITNALVKVARDCKLTIIQKFLTKGNTMMECDSMHSTRQSRGRSGT